MLNWKYHFCLWLLTMMIGRPKNSKSNRWYLMPDGLLTILGTQSDENRLLCFGAGVLAGKVDMFPEYEALCTIEIKNVAIGDTPGSGKDAEHVQQNIISFYQQKNRGRKRKGSTIVVLESFLRTLAINGCGYFSNDTHSSGSSLYITSKPIVLGVLGHPVALNTTSVLKRAFSPMIGATQDDSSIGMSPTSPSSDTQLNKTTKPTVNSSDSPSLHSSLSLCSKEQANQDSERPFTVCVPSALSLRARSDILSAILSQGNNTEVKSIIRYDIECCL